MKILKHLSLAVIILGVLIFLFSSPVFSNSLLSPEALDVISEKDVIIIFNSGGWGNTPLEEALDFAPVIQGIQEDLNQFGYDAVVITFNRTKDNFWGKVAGAKDFFSSFSFSSEVLAKDLEDLVNRFPDKKIVMAGLSNGATFTTKTYEKMSVKARESVYAISAGLPFWVETEKEQNLLQLDNNGKDSLAIGDAFSLLGSLLKAPRKWLAEIKTEQIAAGHLYPWERPEVGSKIITFLGNKL